MSKNACTVSTPDAGGAELMIVLVEPSLLVALVVHDTVPGWHVVWVPTNTFADPLLGLVKRPPE